MSIKSYKDLEVWNYAVDLAQMMYALTEKFPAAEKYGMISQMRRAAISIPSNIAEGWGRTRKEYIHFLVIAYGSCCELETQIILSQRLKFLSVDDTQVIEAQLASTGRMLKALQKSLQVSPEADTPSPLAA
jgi:four helix bundle protein